MRSLLVTLMVISVGVIAFGQTITWDGTQWPSGSLSNDYFGGFVNISFTGDTDALHSGNSVTYNDPFPTDNWDRTAWGGALADGALWWAVEQNVLETCPICIIITFDQAVTDVSFCLYDLDGTDVIYLEGENGGSTVYPMVTPNDITYTPATGKLDGSTASGDPSPTGGNTACISYAGPVDTIKLSYSSGSGQGMLLGNLSYVPEPATMALLIMGAGTVLRLRRS